ncbi:MAG: transporter substrate-binding domain-containing protein [Alphaproteobacteria bacterium]|nr:transporter substrate-binding domain-containing protein [Alphaproteobacteria bacterium]
MTGSALGRRGLLKGSGAGLAALGAATAAGGVVLNARHAAAQSGEDSLLRTVLDRGRLIVGTGSTNAPWHFENEQGELVGMDIAMARILAKGLFDDETAVEFVQQDPAARIPNITTGKVDIVVQFMTITPGRAQLVAFTRPYYVEGIALLTKPDGEMREFAALEAGGGDTRISILQNVDAETNVHLVLPESQVLLIDTQANVIQALESGRADGAAVDLSTVRWLVKLHPDRYYDSGKRWFSMLYGAAVRQGDPDWLNFVDTTFNVAMHGHQNAIFDAAFADFFGETISARQTGFPPI